MIEFDHRDHFVEDGAIVMLSRTVGEECRVMYCSYMLDRVDSGPPRWKLVFRRDGETLDAEAILHRGDVVELVATNRSGRAAALKRAALHTEPLTAAPAPAPVAELPSNVVAKSEVATPVHANNGAANGTHLAAAVQRAHVYFATPVRDPSVSLAHEDSLLRAQGVFAAARMGLTAKTLWAGAAPLHILRNRLVARFLAHPKATHLLFVDDDVSYQPEDVVRMVEANKPIVGGVYPFKAIDFDVVIDLARKGYSAGLIQGFASRPVVELELDPNGQPIVDGFCARAIAVGAGFLLIQRAALEHMIAELSRLGGFRYWCPEDRAVHTMLFDTVLDRNPKSTAPDPRLLESFGEDVVFLLRARACGVEVWADTKARLSHVGVYRFEMSPLADRIAFNRGEFQPFYVEPSAAAVPAAP